jgi:hypothetical protein
VFDLLHQPGPWSSSVLMRGIFSCILNSHFARVIAAAACLVANVSESRLQPFGSHDEVAAKNIFLVSAGALKCDNFTLVASRIAEYARQNGVDIESFRNPDGKYKSQKQYAIQIVNSHARIASTASLCGAIVQDFGPRGTLAAGLVAEK